MISTAFTQKMSSLSMVKLLHISSLAYEGSPHLGTIIYNGSRTGVKECAYDPGKPVLQWLR
ncbi:hypothetical protein E6C60_2161 [Paenibacillus algicola]|uniref:Uncharacterized protein n=1 Tax=Paenibacillus algicola TaxID=2565926 RepID=A0A4P8XJQ4_9BACL|nr:hypothetical protein E6C60_2161 [Paenibacillus algicola]